MKRRAIFLDRDGTLIEDRGYLRDEKDVVFFPETMRAIRSLADHFLLFIVTNQSGIGSGHLTIDEVERINRRVVDACAAEGVVISAVYTCPHQASDGCECRKPLPFFLEKAAREHDVDLLRSFVVGDHPSDVEAAVRVGARGIYVLTGHGEKHRADLTSRCEIVPGILEASELVLASLASEVLGSGGLVAFPTETVYGLGADAENVAAVRRVFEVKGRPASHPLIVHFAHRDLLSDWASNIPPIAMVLADRFWPGPLTMILDRSARVSDVVTGGQHTVALRVPSHPIALAILKRFGRGVAAPSANRFGRVSPTTALHVRNDLGHDVDLVIDGGPCDVGLESTIVDLTSGAPAILRPGGVSKEAIEAVIGIEVPLASTKQDRVTVRAPGSLESHYAPEAAVVLVERNAIAAVARARKEEGDRVVVLTDDPSIDFGEGVVRLELPASLEGVARTLYARLREADAAGADVVLVVVPRDEGIGLAIADRLQKAAGPR